MRVVVTGAAGRLAAVLLPRLLEDPRIEQVVGIDRRPLALQHAKLAPMRADVRTPGLTSALRGADALVHMAFVLMGGGLGRERHDRALVREINVEGSRRVFECAAAAGVPRLLFLSSAAVYGAWPDNPPLITEAAPLRPNPGFAYGEDKAAVEHWLDGFTFAHPGLAVLRLRPHAILGPHAHPFLRLLLRQPFYPAVPGPAPLTQCLWETDVAEAIALALDRGGPGAYNLAAQPALSLRDMLARRGRWRIALPLPLAAALHRLAWRLTPAVGEPGWVGAMRHSLALDTTRARTELGWQPRYALEDCLARL